MSEIIRKISCNEQLYLDMQDRMNTFAIQFILEYDGTVDKNILEDAINYVLKNTNDNDLKLGNRNWEANTKKVIIKEININSEKLVDDDFFKAKIDYKTHSLEVFLLTHFGKKYIVFKFLHSTCDGKGALSFINNLFKKLRDEELVQCNNKVNEQDVAKDICKYKKNINLIPKYKYNRKINKVKNYIPRWNIISIKGYHSGIIAKIAYSLSKEFKNDEVKFMIPVDIRRHLSNENYLGNMTLPIFLKATKDDSWEEINGKLLYSLKNKEELNSKSLQYFGYHKLPYGLRKVIIKTLMNYFNITKKFSTGSIISYLGRIDINQFSNNMFRIVDFISLPLQQPSGLFSIVVAEVNNKTNIAISSYIEQIKKQEFDEICTRIEDTIKYDIYDKINSSNGKKIEDCIEIIDSQILKNKEKIAIDEFNKKYSYNELKNMLDSIIFKLENNNIRKQENVVIYMKRSFEFICSVLACMKTGVCFIPIDETTNKERIENIIKDSKCKAVLIDDLDIDYEIKKIKVHESIDKGKANNESKKNTENKEVEENTKNTEIEKKEHVKKYNDDDIAYKIYTSGTTGTPKGIEISYKNLFNYLTWTSQAYNTNHNLVMPLFTSLSVDLSITSFFLPLLCGGTIKVFKEIFSSLTLDKILDDNEINIIKATPSHLSLISNKSNNDHIEKIIVGGENFSSKLAKKIIENFENVTLYNEYGPTETTVGCTCQVYKPSNYTNVPIGKCVNNTKAYLINNGEIVTSENVEGEIIISGAGVSQGLINRKSKEIIKINEELFYKTGDIGFIKDSVLHCIR